MDAAFNAGETNKKLTLTVQPEDAANKTVTWSSNNPETAGIDVNTGILTIWSRGKATIRATATDGSGVYGEAIVTVLSTDRSISNLKVNNTSATGILSFNASVLNEDDYAAIRFTKPLGATALFLINSVPVYDFDDPEDTDCLCPGEVSLTEGGNTIVHIVIISESGSSTTYSLSIYRPAPGAIPVESIEISDAIMNTGDMGKTLTLTVLPAEASNKNVTWSSANPEIAGINENTGVLTLKSRGNVTIRATSVDGSNVYGEAVVTVLSTDRSISNLEVNGTGIGGTSSFTARVAGNINTALISFNKPLGAIASFLINDVPVYEFEDKEEPLCTVPSVSLVEGSNIFNIEITSESGTNSAVYILTINRSNAPEGAVEVEIDWMKILDKLQTPDKTTLHLGETAEIRLKGSPPGKFLWLVDTIEQQETGNTFVFDSTGRVTGTYTITVWAGADGGDAVKIEVIQ